MLLDIIVSYIGVLITGAEPGIIIDGMLIVFRAALFSHSQDTPSFFQHAFLLGLRSYRMLCLRRVGLHLQDRAPKKFRMVDDLRVAELGPYVGSVMPFLQTQRESGIQVGSEAIVLVQVFYIFCIYPT